MTKARQRYSTDLTDEQWELLHGLLPKEPGAGEKRGPGRPREVDLREIVNALLYITSTGCQWDRIPHDFPKRGSVRYYFDKWTHDGTFRRINDALREQERVVDEREPTPSAAIIDSQSIKTTETGGDRGWDGGKKSQGTQAAYTR